MELQALRKPTVVEIVSLHETEEAYRFNTNNHDPEEFAHLDLEPISNQEYNSQLNPFSSFMHLLPNADNIKQILIRESHRNLLIDIGKIGSIKGELPRSFEDEFEMVLSQLGLEYSSYFDGEYFVRFDRCSLKDGIHGPGPYHSLRMILTSLITSARCVRAMMKGDDILYLVPWNERMRRDREFRVFVYQSQITAISQYVWDTDLQLSNLDLIDIGNRIRDFQGTSVSPHWDIANYTFDVFVGDSGIDLIEMNSFGVQLAAATCLFHWIRDFEQLYGKTDQVTFRIVA